MDSRERPQGAPSGSLAAAKKLDLTESSNRVPHNPVAVRSRRRISRQLDDALGLPSKYPDPEAIYLPVDWRDLTPATRAFIVECLTAAVA